MRFRWVVFCLGLLSYATMAHAGMSLCGKKLLFVQYAQSAKIQLNNSTNQYELVLENVGDIVPYFTERPERDSGSMTLNAYLDLWKVTEKDNFTQDPPNADFSGKRSGILSGSEVNFAVELKSPLYDDHSKTLIYPIQTLGSKQALKPIEIKNLSLFIDDICLKCW